MMQKEFGEPIVKFDKHIVVKQQGVLVDLLADETGLSKTVLKECLNKGSVWLKRSGRKEQRVRKAKFSVRAKDRLSLYYDEAILQQPSRKLSASPLRKITVYGISLPVCSARGHTMVIIVRY